jgi:hypothetical protein
LFINKIKQNFAGFAAVAIAFAGFSAIAPANAVGTTTTAGQVGYTYANRGTVATSSNSVTITSTVTANTQMNTAYASVSLATVGNAVTLQSGDSLRVTAAYTNLTTNVVPSVIASSMTNIYGASAAVSSYSTVTSATGTVVKDVPLTNFGGSFTPGSITQMDTQVNINWSSTGMNTGDQVRVVFTYELLRGGSTIALPVRNTGTALINAVSLDAASTMVIPSDASNINYQTDAACVWRGENGVTAGTIIDVTIGQTGNSGTLTATNARLYTQGSYSATNPTVTNNSFSFTMPAGTAYDFAKFGINGMLTSPVVGATFTPTLTAVIRGTSTNVLDTCSRNNNSQTAPTATAGGTSVAVTWTNPANPSAFASSWDNVSLYACAPTNNQCGTVTGMNGMYLPNQVIVRGFDYRFNGMLTGSSTSATVTAQSMMPMGMSMGFTQWSTTTEYRYFLVYSSQYGGYQVVTPVTAAIAATVSAPQQQVQNNSAPTPPTTVPLVAPIAVPATGFTPGGSLTLSGANMAKVTEVKIGGTVAKTVASATGVAIDVPKDLKPGAYDLLITTPTGSTQFVGAIKVADPVVVAAKAEQAKAAASIAYRAPVDFTVGKTVTAAQAAAAKSFAAQYRNAKTAVCVAIPASKSTVAAAAAAAAKVCDGFKASIPGIKTSVVVGAPSGDKINRVSAEIQG